MPCTAAEKKQYRAIAHHLKPVILIGDKGLSDGLLAELNRALDDHELIKAKININDREARQQMAQHLCQQTGAELIQSVGKIITLLRRAAKPKPQLSNLLRTQSNH